MHGSYRGISWLICNRQKPSRSPEASSPSMADSLKDSRTDLRVAIAGLGPIGKKVAEALDRGIDGLALAAVSAQHPDKHGNWLAGLTVKPAVLPIEALCEVADIVI